MDDRASVDTFVFTDIEGSSRLWEQSPERMHDALARHDTIARRAVETNGGSVVKMTGDGMCAVFKASSDAIRATVLFLRELADPGSDGCELRIRCGIHAGGAQLRDNDYFGNTVNRAARIMSAAHSGQVLVSQAVVDRVAESLPESVTLRDLGSVRLRDLTTPEHVYQVVHPALRQEFPALRSLESTPNNLPQQTTTFIGRGPVLQDLAALLARTRLLTLTGAGGCGKTRLASQLAANALEQFPDGAWLIELAPLSDPSLVDRTVAQVLGLKEQPGKAVSGTIVDYLRDKRILLVLDNCEHLLDACARLADSVLRQCIGVSIVASSREALAIAGEQAYRVPSLSLPDAKAALAADSAAAFEAVQLFSDRAALVRVDFRVTDQNASKVVSICHRLDGIPLAIELAAARVRTLSIDDIDARLNERFRLLTGGARMALPRQQTLRALIDWSYDLLTDPAKSMLQRLSVFVGGWTLHAAESVCAGDGIPQDDVLQLLVSLTDKSLVTADASDGGSRFRLVETLRQYARDKLLGSGGGEAVRDRHLDCFLALAEAIEPKLHGAEQAASLRRLEEEYDNLRAALEWSVASKRSDKGLRMCAALQRFWITRALFSEGREWCGRALGATTADAPAIERAQTLNCAGLLAYHQTDYPAARAHLEDSLAIHRQLRDRRGIAIALNNLGMVAMDQNDLASARALHEESLAMSRELGNRNAIARSLGNLGMIAREQQDLTSARALFEQCLASMRELGDHDGAATSLHLLGSIALEQADFDVARARYREALAILNELGHRGRMAYSLEELAAAEAAVGRLDLAARLWGASQGLRADIGLPDPAADPVQKARIAAARDASRDTAAFERAWREGKALTLEQTIALVKA